MKYEIRDAENDFLDEYPDEAAARVGVDRLLGRSGDRWAKLGTLKVQKRFDNDAVESVGHGAGLAFWVAFGSVSRPEDTVTVTETATADQVAFLQRRQRSITTETVKLSIGYAVGCSALFGSFIGYASGSALIGLACGVLIALVIVGIGFAMAWSERQRMGWEARRQTVTIKRGPFVVGERAPSALVGGSAAYYACFADGPIDISAAMATSLMRLGPIVSATVVLLPKSGQILEVRGADDSVLYRHPDYLVSGPPPVSTRSPEPSDDGRGTDASSTT